MEEILITISNAEGKSSIITMKLEEGGEIIISCDYTPEDLQKRIEEKKDLYSLIVGRVHNTIFGAGE